MKHLSVRGRPPELDRLFKARSALLALSILVFASCRGVVEESAEIAKVLAPCDAPPSAPRGNVPTDTSASSCVDTVRGIPVVRNPAEGLWRSGEEWTVEEHWRVGTVDAAEGEDGEREVFSGPLISGRIAPDGGVHVLDFATDQVTVFDPDGRYRSRFGGSGDGPGELRRPTALIWDELGRIWVVEPLSRRYSVFDGAGASSPPSPGRREE